MKGYCSALCRDSIAYGVYFGTYSTLKSKIIGDQPNPSILKILLCGALTGEVFWITVYPIDLCKTKIQSDPFRGGKFTGLIPTAKEIYRLEGFKGFYRGYITCVCRTPFSSGFTFVTVETVMKLIGPLGATLE
mmetsp:Transcript_12348/g.12394  ORF Transcript_12348/g.12394 Transcript_12348/m.12394 type:complete len:133 (+) Transcript_12348:269-667(+)